jgi:hypothetical protein
MVMAWYIERLRMNRGSCVRELEELGLFGALLIVINSCVLNFPSLRQSLALAVPAMPLRLGP